MRKQDYLDTVQRIRDKRQELEHAQQLLIELQRMQTMQEEGHAIPASAPGEPALGYEHGGHTEILRDSTQHDGETVGAASQESCKTCGGAHRYCLGTSYTVSPTKGGATPAHDVLELHQEHSSISSSPGAKSFGVKDKKVQEARSRASALSHESAASDGLADPVVLFSRGLRVPGVFSSQFVDVRSSGSAARGPKTDMHPGGDCNTRGNVYEQSAVGATYLWLGHWTYFQVCCLALGCALLCNEVFPGVLSRLELCVCSLWCASHALGSACSWAHSVRWYLEMGPACEPECDCEFVTNAVGRRWLSFWATACTRASVP
jgi:hypothetical protein